MQAIQMEDFEKARAAARQDTGSDREENEKNENEKKKKEMSPYGIQRLYT